MKEIIVRLVSLAVLVSAVAILSGCYAQQGPRPFNVNNCGGYRYLEKVRSDYYVALEIMEEYDGFVCTAYKPIRRSRAFMPKGVEERAYYRKRQQDKARAWRICKQARRDIGWARAAIQTYNQLKRRGCL